MRLSVQWTQNLGIYDDGHEHILLGTISQNENENERHTLTDIAEIHIKYSGI